VELDLSVSKKYELMEDNLNYGFVKKLFAAF